MIYLGVLALLSLLILIHELGHLAAAKWVGIPVDSFSVGFGPKLWKRRYGQVEYSLRALPLGGFVAPAGDEEEFRAIPLYKRLVFFLGGPLANLLATLPILAAIQVLGHGLSAYNLLVAPLEQLLGACFQLVGMLPGLFMKPESLSGVVGIVLQGGQMAKAGMILDFGLSLSISVGVLNLLPIPVLDGGQITLSCLEAMFPRLARLRVPLTLAGLTLLAALMVYTNGHDVVRYWQLG
ncbi:MAG: site-2 protease family protein [Acidobacteriota bacterium]